MMNRERQSRNQTKVLRVLRAFAVKVQPRIHREEREDFAKKNPFLPAKDFRVSSSDEHGAAQAQPKSLTAETGRTRR